MPITIVDSFAESKLPAAPLRSQFVYEVETPYSMHMHIAQEEDRLIQRRLAMLNGLQNETVKLERKQRTDRAHARSLAMAEGPAAATAAAAATMGASSRGLAVPLGLAEGSSGAAGGRACA